MIFILYFPGGRPLATSDNKHRLRRNVTLDNRRTSVSLEGHIWEALTEICKAEGVSIDALCTAVAERRVRSSMSSALRVFVLLYFRRLAEEKEAEQAAGLHDGHDRFAITLDRFHETELKADHD